MTPDLDWMDMFTLCQSDYSDMGVWLRCQCDPDVPLGICDPDMETLGDLYLIAVKHIEREHHAG